MSAKGRRQGPAVPFEFFPTPAWAVHRLLDHDGRDLLSPRDVRRDTVRVLEPAVGDGAIVRATTEWQAAFTHPVASIEKRVRRPVEWTGVELRRGALRPDTALARHDEGVDFRVWADAYLGPRFDLALGNPPFSLAEAFARECIRVAHVVALLLRVDFLGSAERIDFWRNVGFQPAIRVLPDRCSFDGKGQDSAYTAWFIWNDPMITGVTVLDATPAEVRKAQRPTETPLALQTALDLEAAE